MATVPSVGSSNPEAMLDKMIAQQERMFALEVKKDTHKMEHEFQMGTSKDMGSAAQKS
ncbi:hypothetical protein KEU06_00860 [Pseudaminobacter sp. 19-2017]|uniref:Uncharacterized protein n=1 Tax=Pseudaminobacter soli (ex Zhang et al. 2022) TaxID=2831468 RepID=A0A942DYB9_9HYPH|nr:hypothetical protein [Pseudaminobacter soli]MBS3647175.1 hypothetical protein [Pseudaminobacter soli]